MALCNVAFQPTRLIKYNECQKNSNEDLVGYIDVHIRSFFPRRMLNGDLNSREAGDLRRYRAHYDAIVMGWPTSAPLSIGWLLVVTW